MSGKHDQFIATLFQNVEISDICSSDGHCVDCLYFYSMESTKMKREILIQKTIDSLSKLSDEKIKSVSDFTEFLISKIDDTLISEGIQKLTTDSKSFGFLKKEETLYSKTDLKESYK